MNMKMKRLVCFVLSLLMLSCIFSLHIEKAFAIDNSAVIDKILASDGTVNDYYGISVAISGDIVVVGAHGDDNKGSVYVYDLSSGTGSLSDVLASQLKLTASDGASRDYFGVSVAISGSKVIVGAHGNSDKGFCTGSAYVYDLSSGAASLSDILASELKLAASDGAADEFFGNEVAISGDKVVVGAEGDGDNGYYSGSAYVYDLSSGTGSVSDVLASERKLTASDGAANDSFGIQVAISGAKVVIGAEGDGDNGNYSGSAYIYDLSSGTGSLSDILASELKLTASDGAADDYFGSEVVIDGAKVVVGAFKDNNTGSAYVYDLSSGTGSLSDVLASELKLTASDGAANDEFGSAVTIDGASVVVGARKDNNTGSAYVYDLSSGTGSESDVLASERKLTASDGAAGDCFGCAVATSGAKVVIGAYRDADNGYCSGSIYTNIGKYSVALDTQGGTGGDTRVTATYLAPMPIANAPSRAGYTFDGYYTEINGGGTNYYNSGMTSANDWNTIGGDILYANWIVNSYSVSFDGNGSDGGSMPDQSFVYDTAQALTANGYTKTGYTFAGWTTSATGGVIYSDCQSVNNLTSVNGDTVTLYAKWTGNPYNVTLDKQGGTSGDYSVTATYGSPMPFANKPTKAWYTFEGYYTEKNGGGTKYYSGNMSSAKDWNIASDTILYAHWTESSPLAINTPNLLAGTLGERYSGAVAVSGGDGNYLWYVSGLPSGLSIAHDTGTISGKPNKTGTFSVKVSVYDGENKRAEKTYSLDVSSPSETSKYEIVPDTDSSYTVSKESGGFTTLTISSDVSGFRYVDVVITPVITHEGNETVVFTHTRNGVQIGFSFNKADFDITSTAGAGFNVQAGDVIKIYVVDELSNDSNINPVLLQ